MAENINFDYFSAKIIQAEQFIGPFNDVGEQGSIGISASFDVTSSGFLLTDQSDPESKKLIKVDQGDLIISDEDGSNPEIVLDTSNQASQITKCDHLEISPDSNSNIKLLYIKDVTGNTADIVDIQTDSSTDPVFKISSSGQTTISNLVLTTADINGGTIDGTTIGASTATSGAFTTITASTSLDVTGSLGIILQYDKTITNPENDRNTVLISGDVASGTHIFKSDGDHDVILKTGNSTTGKITIENGTNGNIAITPNGTGEVDISKVDIDSGTIDNTVIGGTTPANASFNQLFIKYKIITTTELNEQDNLLHSTYSNSVLYFNLSEDSTASISFGTDGQVLHMFYGCSHNLAITFSGGLKCGSGTENILTFNADGQSASLVFIGDPINKWCILNTGAIVG